MKQKHQIGFYAVIAVVICLIIFGIGLILQTYHSYIEQFMEIQDRKQLQLAQSVDRNIESLLNQSCKSLEYILSLQQFQTAEKKWLNNEENSAHFLADLTGNYLDENDFVSNIIAIQDNQILLDAQGKANYRFLNNDTGSSQRICLDTAQNVYLAMICEGQKNIAYASLIDLELLYQRISTTELVDSNQLILLDQNRSILIHFCTDDRVVKSTLVKNCPMRKDFLLILSAEENQQQDCFPFVYQTRKMSKGYNSHIMIIPSQKSENKAFAVGLVNNIDAALLPLQTSSLHWLLGSLVIFLGISLLLILVLHYRRREEQGARELELLRLKNISMEELNRKTQEIAHHQRLEMIGTLTSGIAHEFNNLLTPIMGYSMLTLEQLSPEQEELYDNVLEIYNASCKAREITAQLSQYSRKNSGESKTFLQTENLISKVLHVALPACPHNVTVRCLSGSANAKIYGNETQLSQLLLNLIINSFHAMSENGGILMISTNIEQGQVLIQLKDNGCGIPESVLTHIFEPFFTTKEGGKGSGLGLAIVQQIVEEHQGSIEVASKEGNGSTFTVRLPAYYQ